MKYKANKILCFLASIAWVLLVIACEEKDEPMPEAAVLTVSSVTPLSGNTGTLVTIDGEGFSAIASENVVKFNGQSASVNSSSATRLVVVVPDNAGDGPLTVTVGDKSVIGATFDYLEDVEPIHAITAIRPQAGRNGIYVTITGANFSPTTAENLVKFNGVAALVVSATATELVVEVPLRAGDGIVTVDVNDKTAEGPMFDFEETYLVTTFSGGAQGFSDGTGTEAQFNELSGTAFDANGNLYVADVLNHSIRKISSDGNVTTIAGNGTAGYNDGTGTNARFNAPAGVAVDATGNIIVTDGFNHRIRKITPDGVVTTLAGNGTAGSANGFGTDAQFNRPNGIVINASGEIYVSEYAGHTIRKITPAGNVTTLAGSGAAGFADGVGTAARFNTLAGLTIDAAGVLYVADAFNHRIRKITPAGVVTNFSGNGYAGFTDGAGADVRFNKPGGVSVDAKGNIYVADINNHVIRKITPAGGVTTIAGTGYIGTADGEGPAAAFYNPSRITIDKLGDLYVSEPGNHRIRKIIWQ